MTGTLESRHIVGCLAAASNNDHNGAQVADCLANSETLSTVSRVRMKRFIRSTGSFMRERIEKRCCLFFPPSGPQVLMGCRSSPRKKGRYL